MCTTLYNNTNLYLYFSIQYAFYERMYNSVYIHTVSYASSKITAQFNLQLKNLLWNVAWVHQSIHGHFKACRFYDNIFRTVTLDMAKTHMFMSMNVGTSCEFFFFSFSFLLGFCSKNKTFNMFKLGLYQREQIFSMTKQMKTIKWKK